MKTSILFYRECLKRLIKFIPEPDDFKALIANLRSSYDLFLRQDGQQKLKYVSIDGTLTGCLNEVRGVFLE